MAKSPAFQFYVQDFLSGTMQFTAEEVGAYVRLLCQQWDKGFVPDDDGAIVRLSGVKKKRLPNVMAKFDKGEDGHLRNDKMERVRKAQEEYRKKQTDNGRLGGRPPKPKREPKENPEVNPNESQAKPSPNPDETSSSSSSSSTSPSGRIDQRDTYGDLRKSNLFRQPVIPTIDQVREAFFQQGGSLEMADKFFLKHNAVGWFIGQNAILNFKNLIPVYIENWQKNEAREQGVKDMRL